MALRKPPLRNPNFTHIFTRPGVPWSHSDRKTPKVTDEYSAIHQPAIEIFPDELDPEEFTDELYRDWISHFAQEYKQEVKDAILNQEFKNSSLPARFGGGVWPPLNQDYARWKEKNDLPGANMMWFRSGQLFEAIEVRFFPQVGSQGAWGVGIPASATFDEVVTTERSWHLGRDTGKSILWIARILEFGASGAGIPPRPLFRPIKSRMLKSVRRIFNDWATTEGVI